MPPELRQVTVVSGKGRTGKTTFIASLAALAHKPVPADCDIDAANLHLLLDPDVGLEEEFLGAKVAVRDEGRCGKAGACAEQCRFGAITPQGADIFACEGCGACVLVCFPDALMLQPIVNGHYRVSETRFGPVAHAKLLPGAESSGRFPTKVLQLAEEIALREGRDLVLVDGFPGIGYTTVAAMADVDLALVVAGPALSGISDMERMIGLAHHFGLPVAVVINKADLDAVNAERIRRSCEDRGITAPAELPFDDVVARSIAAQVPLVEHDDGPVSRGIRAA